MRKKLFTTMVVLAAVASVMITGCSSSNAGTTESTTKVQETTTEAQETTTEKTEETSQAVEEKDAEYYYELGRYYLYGTDGNEIDLETAYANFMMAEEMGYTEANFYLGVLFDWYGYPNKDYVTAREYYEACGENPYAQISLGFLYYNGQGVDKDEERAKELFQSVVDQGCVEGYLGLACIVQNESDYYTAYEYYNKASEGTEPLFVAKAMFDIGRMYYRGEGVEQDYAKEMEWYEKAADLGYADAMHNIGYMYNYGEGVEQDYAKALEWYEKAAKGGNGSSANNIGYMYFYGEGVEQDYDKALEWYEKAVGMGNTTAMRSIGYMYFYGKGVEQDYAKGLEWYEKAAGMGDTAAMNNIGYIYFYGEGVEKDNSKALEWFEKAIELGNEDAKYTAEHLREILNQ